MILNLVSSLTNNLLLKLLALFLGLVVYAHVYTEQEHEALIRAPLRVIGLPATLVLNEPAPEFVELNARGKGKQVFKLRFDHPEILVNLSGVNAGKVQRMLSPTDVAIPLGTEVSVTSIVAPQMIVFSVDTLIERSLLVEPVLDGEPPEGFVLSGRVRLEPDRVTVRGPSLLVEDLASLGTEPIWLKDMRGGADLEVSLHADPSLVITPPLVTASVPMVAVVRRELPLTPVRVSDLSSGLIAEVDGDTAWVTVSGPEASLDRLAASRPGVLLDGTGLTPGRHLLTPRIRLPEPAVTRATAFRPARFLVHIGTAPP